MPRGNGITHSHSSCWFCRLFKAKEQDLDTHQPEVSVPGKCSVVRMRGLPFSACISDILDFFKGIPSLDKESVYLVYDSGRPSGEAYIMFASSEGCAAAMRLHKQKMGSRYIELFPSSNADVQRAAKQRKLRLCKPEGIVPKAVPREKTSSTGEAKSAKPAVAVTKGAAWSVKEDCGRYVARAGASRRKLWILPAIKAAHVEYVHNCAVLCSGPSNARKKTTIGDNNSTSASHSTSQENICGMLSDSWSLLEECIVPQLYQVR